MLIGILKLLILLNVDLKDDEIRRCLHLHSDLRDQLGAELGVQLEPLDPNRPKDKLQSHDILLAEVHFIIFILRNCFSIFQREINFQLVM